MTCHRLFIGDWSYVTEAVLLKSTPCMLAPATHVSAPSRCFAPLVHHGTGTRQRRRTSIFPSDSLFVLLIGVDRCSGGRTEKGRGNAARVRVTGLGDDVSSRLRSSPKQQQQRYVISAFATSRWGWVCWYISLRHIVMILNDAVCADNILSFT